MLFILHARLRVHSGIRLSLRPLGAMQSIVAIIEGHRFRKARALSTPRGRGRVSGRVTVGIDV